MSLNVWVLVIVLGGMVAVAGWQNFRSKTAADLSNQNGGSVESSVKSDPNFNQPEDQVGGQMSNVPNQTSPDPDQSTVGWVNYSDRSLGMSLKYPSGWSVKDQTNINNGNKTSYKWFQSPEKSGLEDYDFGITYLEGGKMSDYRGEAVNLGGKQAVRVEDRYYIEINNQLYEIDVRNKQYGPTILQTLNIK